MTRLRRNRDAVAPSLFPFLAVLLCTMGALVLILMLIVSGAQASTRRTTQAIEQEIEIQQAALEIQQRSLHNDFEEGQIEVEKKRLALQGVESHIQQALSELSQLAKTDALLEASQTAESEADELRKLTELEKQLADAKSELLNRSPKPAGEKPIFAIIPYDGRNGTHRRPIYLECVGDKLVIQPEGVELTRRDLQPPYGPGNPLDAALRTIRSEYVPANGAVTSTAYPLLVVRPSGVLAYARARQAMSGWDDQFGYELIDEELELAFPESKPGLKQRIASSLSLARERQAAIAMAMPRSYRGAMDFSDGSAVRAEPTSYSGSRGQGTGSGGTRGGFSGASSADAIPGASSHEVNAILDGIGGFGTGGAGQTQTNQAGRSQSGATGSQFNSDSLLAMPGSQSGGNDLAHGQSMFSGSGAEGGVDVSSESGGSGSADGPASGNQAASDNSSSRRGVVGGSGAGYGQASQPPPGSPGGASGAGSMQAGGEQVGIPTFGMTANMVQQSGSPTGQQASAGGQPSGSSNRSSQSGSSSRRSSGASKSRSGSGGSQGGSSSQTQPVAASRGRDWAWSGDRRTLTPVSRSIRLLCTTGAWILPASRSGGQPTVIRYEGTPVQRAEQLAGIIRKKVDSWGYALDGGYWKPELVVEVGPGAQWRYEQLIRLFESSGLKIISARNQPTGATTLPRRNR